MLQNIKQNLSMTSINNKQACISSMNKFNLYVVMQTSLAIPLIGTLCLDAEDEYKDLFLALSAEALKIAPSFDATFILPILTSLHGFTGMTCFPVQPLSLAGGFCSSFAGGFFSDTHDKRVARKKKQN